MTTGEKYTPIAWTPDMSVGVPELDADHQRLVGLINRLGESADHEDPAIIEGVLDDLLTYTTDHFAREEDYMRQVGFPELVEHMVAHDALTRQVEQLRIKFFLGDVAHIGKETLLFLQNWLTRHILQEDMRYNPTRAHPADTEAAKGQPAPQSAPPQACR
jgi:hemerythrin